MMDPERFNDRGSRLKITGIKTFLMNATPDRENAGGRANRNWLFVKVMTDEGIYRIGEGSGWPRIAEIAVRDLSPFGRKGPEPDSRILPRHHRGAGAGAR
jgi:L-alanine-DL-glutamate epimerase-like enolase superfamily enzyme